METILTDLLGEAGYALFLIISGLIWRILKKGEKDDILLKEGLSLLLKDRLMKQWSEARKSGTLPMDKREDLSHIYSVYTALGGNGVAEDMVREIRKLPTEKESS